MPYAEVRAVIEKHCIQCHSDHTTVPAFPIAPGGVMFDTPEQTKKHADRIRVRTFVEKTMPLLNKTGMTEEERALLAKWAESGARL